MKKFSIFILILSLLFCFSLGSLALAADDTKGQSTPSAPTTGSTPCATANCKATCGPGETPVIKTCATGKCCEKPAATTTGDKTGPATTGGSSVPQTGGSVALTNPLSGVGEGTAGVAEVIARIINLILGVVGSFALLMFVYGGFLMITSAGHSEQVKKGKDTLTWSILGIAVILGSYILASYVISGFQGQITPTGQGSPSSGPATDDSKCTAWAGKCVNIPQCTDPATNKPAVNFSICIKQYIDLHPDTTCQQNLCSGTAQNVCCKTIQTTKACADVSGQCIQIPCAGTDYVKCAKDIDMTCTTGKCTGYPSSVLCCQ